MQAVLPEELDDVSLNLASVVCPFSDESPNEDFHTKSLWADLPHVDKKIGHYMGLFAGRFNTKEYLLDSSSGGLTSWVCCQLLRRGHIDGVVHVGPAADARHGLYDFQISRTLDELKSRRKSQYYSVSAHEVLKGIRGDGLRYAFVGVPCFIKAVRNIAREDSVLNKQIAFALGLVCGHLKSSAFAELMAWQVGVPPDRLASVDFRVKDSGKPASRYSFAASSVDGKRRQRTSNQLVGGNWGHATMQLNACNYCDDIFAELADVTFGDAWIPRYESEWLGTNIVVSRSLLISEILNDASKSGEVKLDHVSVDELVQSQEGNFRHRREGLALRLADDDAAGLHRPEKRVSANGEELSENRREIVRLRRAMGQASHELFLYAKNLGSVRPYLRGIGKFTSRMDALTKPPVTLRAVRKVMRMLGLSR